MEKLIYSRNDDEHERGQIAGWNLRDDGTHYTAFPRISRKDYMTMKNTSLPEVEGVLECRLDSFKYITPRQREYYMRTKKIVRKETDEGERLMIVPRLPTADVTEIDESDKHELGEIPYDLAQENPSQPPLRTKKKKTFPLMTVLNDGDLQIKYGLSKKQISMAAQMTVGDAKTAAVFLQEVMNQNQPDFQIVVKPADAIRSRSQACLVIKTMGKGCPFFSAYIESALIGSEFFMYGPEGEKDWHVKGPCKVFDQIRMVYDLVAHAGVVDVNFLLGVELAVLMIDIFDGVSYIHPEVQFHAAIDDMQALRSVQSALPSTSTRLNFSTLIDRLRPVRDDDGQLATAVRISDRHILMNTHVMEVAPDARVDGVIPTPYKQMGRDTWCCVLPGKANSWLMRPPVQGEPVCIAYNLDGVVRTSSVLRILSFTDSVITMTKAHDVVEGTSGGAIVAMSDMAFLGIHSAETNVSLIACKFGSEQFAEVLEGDEVSSVSRGSDGESFGAHAIKTLKKKGLGNVVKAAMESLVPVSASFVHVGMAVRFDELLYTTCDPDLNLKLGTQQRPAVFRSCDSPGVFRCDNPFFELSTPLYTRAPKYFEKVFVIGKDLEDVFFSSETTVCHIGLNGSSFVLQGISGLDKPLDGGLVMAWDGAILGFCAAVSMSTPIGHGIQCKAVPETQVKVANDPVATLAIKFPFLNITSWDPHLIEEIFVHSSVGKYSDASKPFNAGCKPLANIGDNIAKTLLYEQLRYENIPHCVWSKSMQSLQTNVTYANIAWKFGFAECLIIGPNVTILRESKSYADLTEALIGAVYLMEKPTVLRQFCRILGVIPSSVDTDDCFQSAVD